MKRSIPLLLLTTTLATSAQEHNAPRVTALERCIKKDNEGFKGDHLVTFVAHLTNGKTLKSHGHNGSEHLKPDGYYFYSWEYEGRIFYSRNIGDSVSDPVEEQAKAYFSQLNDMFNEAEAAKNSKQKSCCVLQ